MKKERIRYEDDFESSNEPTRKEATTGGEFVNNYVQRTYRPRRRRTIRRMKKPFNVEVVFTEDATSLQMPEKKTKGSAGYDLKSLEKVVIGPHQIYHKLRTGVKMKIPYGTVGDLSMRSSKGDKGLILTNSPGRIDSDYRGEIMGTIYNCSDEEITIEAGESIFQIVFTPIRIGYVTAVPEFSQDHFTNERGEGGYGSTDDKPIVTEHE